MVVDVETGIKKLNKIRLNGATNRTEAVKGMYALLQSIKDGEITTKKSGPDFKMFRADPQIIRAVTFDVGGTLIEPWPSVGDVYASVAAEFGCQGISPSALNDNFAAAWRAKMQFDYSRGAWRELVDATFAGLIPEPPSRDFFEALYGRFESVEVPIAN